MNALLTSLYLLVFTTPESSTIVGTFDSRADCEEVAWTMERYLTGDATFVCEKEQPIVVGPRAKA